MTKLVLPHKQIILTSQFSPGKDRKNNVVEMKASSAEGLGEKYPDNGWKDGWMGGWVDGWMI